MRFSNKLKGQISLSSPKGQPLPAAFSPSESVSSIEPPLVYIDYMLESRNTKGFKRGGPKNSIFKVRQIVERSKGETDTDLLL